MLFFIIFLVCAMAVLWFVPVFRKSRNRNLIALQSSGAGCLSLLLLLFAGVLAALVFHLPLSLLPVFAIAFFTLPLIAAAFSAYLAVKVSRKNGLEGTPPSARATLYYLLLCLIGITVWFGEKCVEMKKIRETWSVEISPSFSGVRRVTVCQRLVNPVFERYEGSLRVAGADGTVRSLPFPPRRMDGRKVVNLYAIRGSGLPDQPLFLFADGESAFLADPVAMRFLQVERGEKTVAVGGKEIPSHEIFRNAEYLGVFRGAEFFDSSRAPELPLRGMYGEKTTAAP